MITDKSVKRGKDGRIMHPNSLAALLPTQWPKGVSGNNGGNGYSLTAELKHALNQQKRLEIVNSTIEGAIKREPTPFKELWDRVEGKVPDKGQPLNDNRVLNIIVINQHTSDLIALVGERARKSLKVLAPMGEIASEQLRNPATTQGAQL